MKLLIAATATVHFVGLCMLMNGDRNDPVHVVLPRDEATMQRIESRPVAQRHDIQLVSATQSRDSRRFEVPRELATQFVPVGGHTAIIAFKGTVQQGSTWTAQTLKPVPEYQYVLLNGEHVRFSTIKSGGEPPAIPDAVPHVGHGCNHPPELADVYRPPDYAKAAAVVKIDAGTLTACNPKVNGTYSARIDTYWAFETNGPLVIEMIRGGNKKLIIDTTEPVIVGNVPTPWFNSAPNELTAATSEPNHYPVFFTMLRDARNCQHEHRTTASCGDEIGMSPLAVSEGGFGTGPSKVWREAAPPPRPTEPTPHKFETYSCSNSQYP